MILRRLRASLLACACALGLAALPSSYAAGTVLQPGDIAVIGANCSDNGDIDQDIELYFRWAVVVLRQLEPGTEVNFINYGANSNGAIPSISPSRVVYGYVAWRVDRTVPPGTVLAMSTSYGSNSFDQNGTADGKGGLKDFGTQTVGDPNNTSYLAIHGSGGWLFGERNGFLAVFQGTPDAPRFIYAWTNGRILGLPSPGMWGDVGWYLPNYDIVGLPPGLTNQTSAVALTSNTGGPIDTPSGPMGYENMVYFGPTEGTREYLLQCIGTPFYWVGREDVGYPIGVGPGFQFASHFKITTQSPPSVIATSLNPAPSTVGAAVPLWSGVDARTNDSGQKFVSLTLGVSGLANGASETLTISGTAVPLVAGGSGTAGSSIYSVVAAGSGAVEVRLTNVPIIAGGMNALITGLAYRNTAASVVDGTRTVTILSITDDGSDGLNVGTPNLTSIVANLAPTLVATALNPACGPQTTGVDLFGAVQAKTNNYGDTFVSLGLWINGTVDGANEVLVVNGVDLPLVGGSGSIDGLGTYTVNAGPSSRIVTFSGLSLDDAAMSALIDGLAYRNAAAAPTLGNRAVIIASLRDSGAAANSVGPMLTSTVAVTANHAPVLTACNPVLTPIQATDVANSGQTVASIVGTSITDTDSGARRGIALAQFFLDYTRWQFSTNDGLSWTNFLAAPGNPEGGLLLLREADRVRYVPDGIHEGSAALVYLAWDQTGATAGMQGRWYDASGFAPFGGTTPFSADTAPDLATLTILGITPGSFQDWVVTNFTAAERQQTAYTSPSGDPAGCGVTNLMRYALNLALRGPVTAPIKLVSKTEGGVDYAALEFPRRNVAPGLTYTVQASSDLVGWITVGSCGVEDGSLMTIRDTAARSTFPRRFLRLQVSITP